MFICLNFLIIVCFNDCVFTKYEYLYVVVVGSLMFSKWVSISDININVVHRRYITYTTVDGCTHLILYIYIYIYDIYDIEYINCIERIIDIYTVYFLMVVPTLLLDNPGNPRNSNHWALTISISHSLYCNL